MRTLGAFSQNKKAGLLRVVYGINFAVGPQLKNTRIFLCYILSVFINLSLIFFTIH